MKKIVMALILTTSSTLMINQVLAGQYAIQLESSTSPDLTRYSHLKKYGNLYKVNADRGFVRTRLGPFINKQTTLDILEKVRVVGPNDAFITNYMGNVSARTIDPKTTNDIENFDVRTMNEWRLLTPEQQANLVYLDGALHVKKGSIFTPLNEVVRNNK